MNPFVAKMFYSVIASPRTRWMLFTLIFGSAPIVVRWFSALTAVDRAIPYFVLSDFVFLALMFNASVIANLSTQKFLPDVFFIFTVVPAAASSILVCIFMQDVNGQASAVGWIITLTILLFALILSFFATNSKTMESIQKEIDFATNLSELPPDIVDSIIKEVCAKTKDDAKEYHDVIRKTTAELVERRRSKQI
jgi:hypothetical protein